MPKTLYICYFGLRQPLVQTQVIPYLLEIRKGGIEIILLTFEPNFNTDWTHEQIENERKALREKGIDWHCLPYHKTPSAIATTYDILNGAWFINRMIRRENIDILHARVHVPMLMGAIARKFSRNKPKLLFDIRGFFPEEYTDAGVWPENGWLYRTTKRVEKWLMAQAHGFVVLTEKAREILFPESKATGRDKLGRPVEVIPCCVDFAARFAGDGGSLRAKIRRELDVEDRFVYTHVGALGGLYLTENIADFLESARFRDASTFALFLTQTDPNLIIPLLKNRGFADSDFFVGRVAPTEIPAYLHASDAGLSFVKAGYATQSRSPTKIPEYLACGLPIIANPGVGDVDSLILEDCVGVLVKDFTPESYLHALVEIERLSTRPEMAAICRASALKRFDLKSVGGERYRLLYNKLLGR